MYNSNNRRNNEDQELDEESRDRMANLQKEDEVGGYVGVDVYV